MSRAQVLKEAVLGSDRVTGSDGEDATPDMEKANFAARNGARMLARALLGVHGWGERDYQRENRLNWEDLVKKARQQFGREARRTREKKKDTAKRGGPQQPQTKSAKDDTTLDLLLTEARENLTWRRRLTLLERLSPADCHDFRLLFHFLFCAFHCEDYPVWETTYSSTDEGMAVEPYFFDCYRNRYPYALIPGENVCIFPRSIAF